LKNAPVIHKRIEKKKKKKRNEEERKKCSKRFFEFHLAFSFFASFILDKKRRRIEEQKYNGRVNLGVVGTVQFFFDYTLT